MNQMSIRWALYKGVVFGNKVPKRKGTSVELHFLGHLDMYQENQSLNPVDHISTAIYSRNPIQMTQANRISIR